MRIHVGCELTFEFSQTMPMIVTLNVHFSRFSDLERPDHLVTILRSQGKRRRNAASPVMNFDWTAANRGERESAIRAWLKLEAFHAAAASKKAEGNQQQAKLLEAATVASVAMAKARARTIASGGCPTRLRVRTRERSIRPECSCLA